MNKRERKHQAELVRVPYILEAVCQKFRLSRDEILGRGRTAYVVEARREAAQRLRETGLTLQAIGRILNRHHATIINLLKGD